MKRKPIHWDYEDMAVAYGYDGNGYTVGDRVEVHPGTDLWMQGARFGVVIGLSLTPKDRVRVKLDKTGDRIWTGPAERFRNAS